MINQFTGQIVFDEGLSLSPFELLRLSGVIRAEQAPSYLARKRVFELGVFTSKYGRFSVAAGVTQEQRVKEVVLSCPSDVTSSAARWRTVFDAIVLHDLDSMTTFNWGVVAIKHDRHSRLDQMLITYSLDPGVVKPFVSPTPALQEKSVEEAAEDLLRLVMKKVAQSKRKLLKKKDVVEE